MGKRVGWPNFLNTVISYFKLEDTATRERTFSDRDGRILDDTDLLIPPVAITGTVNLDDTAFGQLHLCSGIVADYTATLPTAAGNSGKTISFKGDIALTKVVTIEGLGTESIDGQLSIPLVAGEQLTLLASGGNWILISSKPSIVCSFTTTLTGFSVNPTNVTVKYIKNGWIVQCWYNAQAGSTSNAVTFTWTAPFVWESSTAHTIVCSVVNGGTFTTGRAQGGAGTNLITMYPGPASAANAWTNSGVKGVSIHFAFSII